MARERHCCSSHQLRNHVLSLGVIPSSAMKACHSSWHRSASPLIRRGNVIGQWGRHETSLTMPLYGRDHKPREEARHFGRESSGPDRIYTRVRAPGAQFPEFSGIRTGVRNAAKIEPPQPIHFLPILSNPVRPPVRSELCTHRKEFMHSLVETLQDLAQ